MKIQLLILLLPLFSAISPLQAVKPAFGKKPNIILVITDDQGHGPIGRHGHHWIQTPNLDKLHDTSVRFNRFLVSPTCSPTRAALMTGRHPLKNGITHTILERERMTLDATILPQVLAKAGYKSGIFGKWHLGDEKPYRPHQRGFHEAFTHGAGGIGQAYPGSCADAPGNKYFNPTILHNGSFVKTKGFCTDIFFTAALGWIKEQKETQNPFFAYITTNAPHGPFIAPPKNTKRFTDLGFSGKHAGFYGMIENIDENMGRLMQKLNEWNLFENTVLVFLSDNGMTGAGSGKGKVGTGKDGKPMLAFNSGMKGHKGSTDEGGVRVPFFIRWDGVLKPGNEIEKISAHIDVLPTFAAIAGVEDLPPNQVEGRNLVPLLKNPKVPWKDRHFFTQTARWKSGTEPNTQQWNKFAVRNQRYRLVGNNLYDMDKDPAQKENIAAKHPKVVQSMKAAYDQFWEEARPLMVNEDVPLAPNRPFHVLHAKQLKEGGIPNWQPPEL